MLDSHKHSANGSHGYLPHGWCWVVERAVKMKKRSRWKIGGGGGKYVEPNKWLLPIIHELPAGCFQQWRFNPRGYFLLLCPPSYIHLWFSREAQARQSRSKIINNEVAVVIYFGGICGLLEEGSMSNNKKKTPGLFIANTCYRKTNSSFLCNQILGRI